MASIQSWSANDQVLSIYITAQIGMVQGYQLVKQSFVE